MKRATVKLKTPNPLFEEWLKEWVDEATGSGNVARFNHFNNALDSLKKFPLVLKSGKDCMILEHFNAEICSLLDRKLASLENNFEGAVQVNSGAVSTEGLGCQSLSVPKPKEKKRTPEFKPALGSAAYALLITLFKKESTPGYKGFMTKEELIKEAQGLSKVSFKKVQNGTLFTGWSTISQLVNKGLVFKSNKPARFSLLEEGRRIAVQLLDYDSPTSEAKSVMHEPPAFVNHDLNSILAPVSSRTKKQPDVQISQEENQSLENEEDFVLSPGTFDVILLVDNNETAGASQIDDATITELKSTGVKFEVRHLKVGDFLWICRSRTSNVELVLPFIVERKRLDDLSKSIIDGRFHEQKFRLKKCGVYNPIYLIEECKGQKFGLPLSSLHQAIINTMVSDGFTVKFTANHSESMSYLAMVTTVLTNKFKNKVIFSCKEAESSLDVTEDAIFLLTFKTFIYDMGKSRNFKTREMFVKQLVQLHGMSADKAWAIANIYATPAAIISALKDSSDPAELVSGVKYGALNRKIGSVMSGQLNQFYSLLKLK